jgi:hypothetical protein
MVGAHMAGDPAELDRADLREAYERGRKDERARRRRHPVGMTLTFIAALIGLAVLLLAAAYGSFGRAGGVIDHQLAMLMGRAAPQVGAVARPADAAQIPG